MSRLDYVTIAIVAVCVAALIYLIYMTTNLLGGSPEEPAKTEETSPIYEDTSTYSDTSYYDSQEATTSGETSGEYDRSGDNIAEGDLDKGTTTSSSPKSEEKYQDTPVEEYTAPRTTSTGNYMVLAGTFSVKAYAEEMVGKLHGLGYANATTEPFDRGKYSVVLVDRFSSIGEAKNLVTELKGKGVDAYVKKK